MGSIFSRRRAGAAVQAAPPGCAGVRERDGQRRRATMKRAHDSEDHAVRPKQSRLEGAEGGPGAAAAAANSTGSGAAPIAAPAAAPAAPAAATAAPAAPAVAAVAAGGGAPPPTAAAAPPPQAGSLDGGATAMPTVPATEASMPPGYGVPGAEAGMLPYTMFPPGAGMVAGFPPGMMAGAMAMPGGAVPPDGGHAPYMIPASVAGGHPMMVMAPPHDPNGQAPVQQAAQPAMYQPRLKVEDALSYLDQVKAQFAEDNSRVYTQFLDIMKLFKSQAIDTPGVIRRVSELFHGHPDLVIGFNTFLPPGYKIDVADPKTGQVVLRQPNQPAQFFPVIQPQPQSQPASRPTRQEARQPMSQAQQQQAPEFDHAINYVNQIKNRFQHDLDTYKSFLEILHTYQKEQKSIKEVYAQVAELFYGHPDLLDEFSKFLPEAVPHHQQAKAANSRIKRQQKRQRRDAAAASSEQVFPDPPPRSKRLPVPTMAQFMQSDNFLDLAFFDKVKKALGRRHIYEKFLKCLELFIREVISPAELLTLVKPFIEHHPDVELWLKAFIGSGDSADGRPSLFDTAELDLGSCERLDVSYRALPDSRVRQLCSGRVRLDEQIMGTLNDHWVSYPSFSEETTFLTTKKNPYEDAIFRCEDERFELDVILEQNLSTIRVLDMVVKNLEDMNAEQRRTFKFNDKTFGGRSEIIHRKCIKRIYGDRAEDAIQAMKRDPFTFVPHILGRLRSKHTEWKQIQRDWDVIWREINEKNCIKALDYKAINFKRNDPLQFKPKQIKTKARDLREEWRQFRAAIQAGEVSPKKPSRLPFTQYKYDDEATIDDCAMLILRAVKASTTISAGDRARVETRAERFLQKHLRAFLLGLPFEEESFADDGAPIEAKSAAVNGAAASGTTGEAPAAVPDDDDDMEATNATSKEGTVPALEKPLAAAFSAEYRAATAPMVTPEPDAKDDLGSDIFWGSGKWYVFHTLHQTLHERVKSIKEAAKALGKKPSLHLMEDTPHAVPAARELDYRHDSKVEPFEAYGKFVDLTSQLVDGELETSVYEETMRSIFTTRAYVVFTIDKLLQQIVKQLCSITIGDASAIRLWTMFVQSRKHESAVDYRKDAVALLGEHNIYRVERQAASRQVVMQLVDPTYQEDMLSAREKWEVYIENYMATADVDPHLKPFMRGSVFLNRTSRRAGLAPDQAKSLENVAVENGLRCKIGVNSYKLKYETNTLDRFHRTKGKGAKDDSADSGAAKLKTARHKKFRGFVDAFREKYVPPVLEKACERMFMGHDLPGVTKDTLVSGEGEHYVRYTTTIQQPGEIMSSQ